MHDSIGAIDAAAWNRLDGAGQPFLRHEFLSALENSGAVGTRSGWLAHYLVATADTGELAGALPLYLKNDSWGEFVFDWAWADAYRRAGLRYFPKLVCAVPFTPATGPRLLIAPGRDDAAVAAALVEGALDYTRDLGCSSLHVLFPDTASLATFRSRDFLVRKDCQFHWHNRGYADFEAFLGDFTAEKRKKVRRERRRVTEAGIRFRIVSGGEIDEALWADIMPLYAHTFLRRGRSPYLGAAFFSEISRTLPDNLLVILAEHTRQVVAAAILFRSATTLYGRYWGSDGDYHSLHFETCYYQGIEYCIRSGIGRFEPGTQGEHKIARGFVPTEVWSAHWLADPRCARAIDAHLHDERDQVDRYIDVVQDHVPYREDALVAGLSPGKKPAE